MKETLRITLEEKVKIPPEADSYSIDGWDMNNSQQQAYIRAINRHLVKTVDTGDDTKAVKTASTEGDGDRETKEETRENHGIIGCGIYYPWVTQTDQWAEALQKAKAATGYRASWHWNMERGDPAEPGEKIPPKEDRYTKEYEPYQKAYMARKPDKPHAWSVNYKYRSAKRKDWEAEREERFEETLKRHQKMFAELLRDK